MVNKVLVGIGIAVLVAVGSVGVWKLSGSERQVGALGPLDKPVPLSWRGSWSRDAQYQPGEVVAFKGASYVAEAATAGDAPAVDGPWALMAAQGVQGPAGPAGTFGGTLQSPDGKYTLSVTNAGIEAKGPNGQITMDGSGVTVKSGTVLTIDAGSTLDLKSAATTTLRATILRLGCTGGNPAARVGSAIQAQGTGAVGQGGGSFPVNSTGSVTQGSPTVFIC
jgi:hypothetical protein